MGISPKNKLLGVTMNRDRTQFEAAFNNAEKASRTAFHDWTRTIITIMTPSLVLLIGLQGNPASLTTTPRYFLVASIVLMSITILSGLLLLYSESRGNHLLRDSIAAQWNNGGSLDQAGIKIPIIYLFAQKAISFLTPLSILCLTVYGVAKYT